MLFTHLPTTVENSRWTKKGELIKAHPDFQLVISYNPGYQSLMKDLKQSTKQRFTAMNFNYAEAELESLILQNEADVDSEIANKLVQIGEAARKLKGHGLDEGISTRLMVYAAALIAEGVSPLEACEMALVTPITDDEDMYTTLMNTVEMVFG